MFAVDHLAMWTADRDAILAGLAGPLGLPVLDGFSPGRRTVAKGLRFNSGVFLDLHGVPDLPRSTALIGLGGAAGDAVELARAQGWKVRADLRSEHPDPESTAPWSLVSFKKGQGVLSHLFVVDYQPGAPTPADFDQPLHRKGEGVTAGTRLSAMWLRLRNRSEASGDLTALGAREPIKINSEFAPFEGDLYCFPGADLVLTPSLDGEEGVCRLDFAIASERAEIRLSCELTAVVGEQIPA